MEDIIIYLRNIGIKCEETDIAKCNADKKYYLSNNSTLVSVYQYGINHEIYVNSSYKGTVTIKGIKESLVHILTGEELKKL